jgi:hypothetical protein
MKSSGIIGELLFDNIRNIETFIYREPIQKIEVSHFNLDTLEIVHELCIKLFIYPLDERKNK